MRTTLTLEDDVAVRLEKLREERGESLKSVVNEVLRRGLDTLEQRSAERQRYSIESHDAGRCYLPNLDSLHATLALGEGEGYK